MDERGIDGNERDGQHQWRNEANRSPRVEPRQADPAVPPSLGSQHGRDEEPAEDEEHLNGDPRAGPGVEVRVVDDDGREREGPKSSERGAVTQPERRCLGRLRAGCFGDRRHGRRAVPWIGRQPTSVLVGIPVIERLPPDHIIVIALRHGWTLPHRFSAVPRADRDQDPRTHRDTAPIATGCPALRATHASSTVVVTGCAGGAWPTPLHTHAPLWYSGVEPNRAVKNATP